MKALRQPAFADGFSIHWAVLCIREFKHDETTPLANHGRKACRALYHAECVHRPCAQCRPSYLRNFGYTMGAIQFRSKRPELTEGRL